jgi:multidrug efflux pump subunit AcrA (membrane-fusion protein)
MTQHHPRITPAAARSVFAVASVAIALTSCREKPPADHIRVSGYVEATEVRVAPEVGGRLLSLKVTEGDRVKAGDVIAELDTADIALALQRAAAERLAADAQLRLLLAGARAEDIRQAEAQLAAAEAELAASKQELTSAERDLVRFELGRRKAARRCGDAAGCGAGPGERGRAARAGRGRIRRPAQGRRAARGDRRRARQAGRRRRADRHPRKSAARRHRAHAGVGDGDAEAR